MTWECPKCEGGFPAPIVIHNKYSCPWCQHPLLRHVNNQRDYINHGDWLEVPNEE